MAALCLSFLSACENKTTSEKIQEDIENVSEEISDAFRSEQEELEADISEMQRGIKKKIKALEADLENASAEAKTDINQAIKKLEAWGNDLDREMERIGKSAKDEWQTVKTDVRQMLSGLEREWNETFDNEAS